MTHQSKCVPPVLGIVTRTTLAETSCKWKTGGGGRQVMSHGKVSIDREVVEGADRRWGGPGLRCRRGKGPTRTDRTSRYQLPVHGECTVPPHRTMFTPPITLRDGWSEGNQAQALVQLLDWPSRMYAGLGTRSVMPQQSRSRNWA